jgi:carboxymethylenebutenolidase
LCYWIPMAGTTHHRHVTPQTQHETTQHETISIGTMDTYLARPGTPGTYPAIVLAHQLFGVTADVRAAADRIARLGYVVAAPNFFHRSERAAELPMSTRGRSRGFELMGALTRDGVLADVRAARDHLGSRRTGMVGLSMGGHLAYYAATQLDLAVTIVLYAGWLTGTGMPVSRPEPTIELTKGITGRLVFIVGDQDHVIGADQREAIAARLAADGVRHDMIVIPGAPHAFLAEGTPSFDPAAADRAWHIIEQTLDTELKGD